MEDDICYIGTRRAWGGDELAGLGRADRRLHAYVIGKSGSGKTTLLRNLIIQDIARGEGVGVIDPHGDLAEDLLDQIPSSRSDDLLYLNPADRDHPVGLNLLRDVPPERRDVVASGIISAFKGIWREFWGPRLEYILYATVAAILDVGNQTILGVQRMLSDRRYRDWVIRQVKDPAVKRFWIDEFGQYDARFAQEAIAPIQNKVGQLLMAAPVRNILGQVRPKFDARFMMDDGRILIANLAKGRIGEDKANLLGAILVTQFHLAAMSRSDTPEQNRRGFHLFIDEFHSFSTDSLATILSESRKYGLCLTLSHQYLGQLREDVRDAVFGNVGSIISFRVGENDAARLSAEFAGEFTPNRFTDLGNHEICCRLLKGGMEQAPFAGRSLPPLDMRHNLRDRLIMRSRQKYSRPRSIVEAKIQRWMQSRRRR